jgi:hypothetical protein
MQPQSSQNDEANQHNQHIETHHLKYSLAGISCGEASLAMAIVNDVAAVYLV